MSEPIVTVITPTAGKRIDGLMRLRDSLLAQTLPDWNWLIVTDGGVSVPSFCLKDEQSGNHNRISNVIHPEQICTPGAPGAAARALGQIWATTPYVTFCDDDCWYETEHLDYMLTEIATGGMHWGWGLRRIWTNSGRCLGVDRFEACGESGRTPYKLVELNTIVMSRRLAVSWSVFNRDLTTYDEDRRLYQWLRDNPATGGGFESDRVGLNQVCPRRLEMMFEEGCSPA